MKRSSVASSESKSVQLAADLAAVLAEKKKKKKKKSWLKRGLQLAGDVAPVAIPLAMSLLAHPQVRDKTTGLYGSRNLTQMRAVGLGSGVPLAASVSPTNMSPGILSQKEKRDGFGKIASVNVVGQEYIGDVTWSDGAVAGDLLFNEPISPLSSTAFSGTRLANIAASYGRYKLKNCHLVFAPSLAATTGGQIGLAILSDPETVLPQNGGAELVRAITDSAGSDVCQVWSPGMALYPGNVEVEPFYTAPDPDSAGALLKEAGRLVVVAMGTLGDSQAAGSLFFYYEIEFMQPTLEVFATITKYAEIQGQIGASSVTDTSPMGIAAPTLIFDSIGVFGLSGSQIGLPSGAYVVIWDIQSSTAFQNANLQSWIENTLAAAGWTVDSLSTAAVGTPTTSGAYSATIVLFVTTLVGRYLDLSLALQGLTGDTIQTNFLRIATDPFRFPTRSFGRLKRSLAAENDRAKTRCLALQAAEQEAAVAKKIVDLEDAMRRLSTPVFNPTTPGPQYATPGFNYPTNGPINH